MTAVHRDSRNEHLPNLVVPLSDFQNGEIWVEQGDGDVWETSLLAHGQAFSWR